MYVSGTNSVSQRQARRNRHRSCKSPQMHGATACAERGRAQKLRECIGAMLVGT